MEQMSVRYLKGVGPKLELLLNRLKVYTVKDILYYFPVRYEDRSQLTAIKDIKENEYCVICGRVHARNLRKTKKYLSFSKQQYIFEIIVSEGSGKILCLWFNQPFLNNQIHVGDELLLYGKPTRYKGRLQFNAPEHEKVHRSPTKSSSLNFGRIVGFYRLTEGLTQKKMRKIIAEALRAHATAIEDPIPFYIRKERNFFNIVQSLQTIHLPSQFEEAERARQRFIFEEFFFSQLLVYVRKAKRVQQKGIGFCADDEVIQKIKKRLPFKLTVSQEKALNEIQSDMKKAHPMHRLIQGDVGSGKTVVVLFAAGICAGCGYQASLMVPTEVLAYQHYQTLREVFEGFNFNIEILVSSVSKQEREQKLKKLRDGTTAIVVGTHALIEEKVRFKNLGLAIIDEEHKFGVAQRTLLPKKGINPDCIVMSATPIPRSLALSLYGDLDITIIDELPPGRKQPQTIVIGEENRMRVYEFIEKKLKEGRQAYIVYPVIEESQDEDLHSLNEMYRKLKKHFADYCVDVFHGRLKKEEKQKVIESFQGGRTHILVATTVVEVGVNIENATVMVVENPERFGLAQLHQLRGRIRRSIYAPYFILITHPRLAESAQKRISIIEKISDGFVIAEEDLKLRGPGDFFGHVQWGYPQLKVANPLNDIKILKAARRDAYSIIKEDPTLSMPPHQNIKRYFKI